MKSIRYPFSLAVSLVALLGLSGPAMAQNVTFTKIADLATPVPGNGADSFNSIFPPVLDNGVVAFQANVGTSPSVFPGIYSSDGGPLAVVADTNTINPFTGNPFVGPSSPSIDGGVVAFVETVFQDQTIFTVESGTFSVVADTATGVPGGTTTFNSLVSPSIGGPIVAFFGGDTGSKSGIYEESGSGVTIVADTDTPDGDGGFLDRFTFNSAATDGVDVAFFRNTAERCSGIFCFIEPGSLYRTRGGLLEELVMNGETPFPGGGVFEFLAGAPSFDDGRIAFEASSSDGNIAILVHDGTDFQVIADTNTPVPDSLGGNFTNFRSVSTDGGNVVFDGIFGSSNGLFIDTGSSLETLILKGDMLDGKTVNGFSLDPEGLSGNSFAFTANFGNNDSAIYLAEFSFVPQLACDGFRRPYDGPDPVELNKRRVMTLKAKLFDEDGAAVRRRDVDARPVVQVLFEPAGGGEAVDVTHLALPDPRYRVGDKFRFVGGQWRYYLRTKRYKEPGLYTVTMQSGDGEEYEVSPTCQTQFVIH